MVVAFLGGVMRGVPAEAQSSWGRQSQSRPAESMRPIQDNSFLIEEAYNQESGVVQHISTFSRSLSSGAWVYTFTQEWPLLSRCHQISFSIPVQTSRSGAAGIGDIALTYRYQLATGTRSGIFTAPRVTVILPSGSYERDRGAGGTGVELGLPVSVEHSAKLATHWNAGATFTPSARNAAGQKASTRSDHAGASAIWLLHPALNLMLEVAWSRTEAVAAPGEHEASRSLFVAPGVRGALDFRSGLQLVPGNAASQSQWCHSCVPRDLPALSVRYRWPSLTN